MVIRRSSNIRLGKVIKVDKTYLLSDKAIAVRLESWPRECNRIYHRLLYGWVVNPRLVQNRRLLLEHISRPHVSLLKDAHSFIKQKDPQSMMAVMCLIERELNRKADFSQIRHCWIDRHHQLLLEENMKLPLSYAPLTFMSLSGDSLLNFCLNQSANPDTDKVSVDSSKWCHYQTKVFIGPIARVDQFVQDGSHYVFKHFRIQHRYQSKQELENHAKHPKQSRRVFTAQHSTKCTRNWGPL